MRSPVLFAAFFWLRGYLAKEDACQPLEGSPDRQGGGPPLRVNVSSRLTSLFVTWEGSGLARLDHALRLRHLSSLGSPEGQQLQVRTNASSFEFQNLVPGSHYQLEVTALRPCGQNVTVTLRAYTVPLAVHGLQLHGSGSPVSLEASWGDAPGEQDGYQLLLYHLESQTLAHNISLLSGTLSYNFGNLSPGSEYVLEVITRAGNLQAKTSIHQWTAPISPDGLVLRALGTDALRASWNGSEEAAWLHLVLTDLLGGTNLTAVVTRGVSNHTFLHLSPGTPYKLVLSATAGPHWEEGPNATEWTYPSAPLDLVLTPMPPKLCASWTPGPGAWDGYLLLLSGPVEKNTVLGPETLSFTFSGPLPAGHYALELKVLAGPYDAWAQASAWLADSTAQPSLGNDARLQLEGLEATGKPGRRALLYAEGSSGLLGNISVPPHATYLTFCGLVPGAHYRVDIVSSLGVLTQSLMGYTSPLAPQSLEVIGRASPSELAIGWVPALGQREGYRVTWHQEGNQRSLKNLVDLGPDNSSLILQDLVPGSCYTVALWAWVGNLSSSIQMVHSCTPPAPPANFSLGPTSQPPVLTASWCPPPGGRDGFHLRLYRLRSLTLESEEILAPEAHNFSWAQMAPGTEFLAQLATLQGPSESSDANATSWTSPLTPPLVNVTKEGSTQLRVSWVHAPGGRHDYQVTLYQAGTQAGTHTVEAQVDSTRFSALTPGTKYDVEVISRAGPLHSAAAKASGWTSPLTPNELSVSMQSGSAVVSLAWARGPLGQGVCHARLSAAGRHSWEQSLVLGQAYLVLGGLTPGRNHSLSVLCEAGPWRASTQPVLLPVEPGPVEDMQCQPEATRLALTWTVPAGDANTSRGAISLSGLVPTTSYRLSLSALGRNGLRSRALTLVCTTSAETWHPPELATAPQLELEMGLGVMIPRGMFGEDDGQIQWYGVIATTNTSLVRPPWEAINHSWYDHYYGGHDSYLAILLPNPFYPGPWATPGSWTVPMGTQDCGHTQEICNGQLKPGSQYRFSVVAFSRHSSPETIVSFSAYSEPWASVPPTVMPLPVVVGIAAGCVLTVCAVLGLLCWGRAKGQRAEKLRFSQELTTFNLRRTQRPIPIHSFRQSYEAKSELKEVGKEQPRLEAEHPANTAKNRYPHVLPYDHSRVRLSQLEGEPHSDYINANFIPGYTHPQEFIATQGPLKKTLEDFWRLVWEQQVHVIVMLTVGMENGRELKEVGKEQPRLEAEHPANTAKNRYPHVLPYDHSRVRLSQLEGEPHSDYINANFIPGYTHPQEFIATQGPLKKTLEDFWRLVWEQQVHVIVMLTVGMENGRVLCEHYWPADSTPVTHGHITIHLLVEEPEDEWTKREFQLQHVAQQQQRRVKQLQFTTWPDHSVPEAPSSLLAFVDLVREQVKATQGTGPILVHCSAGVGRTGTFVALLRLLEQLEEEKVVDVFNAVYALRLHRPLMIQTPAYAKRAANANAGFLQEYKLLLQAIKEEAGSWTPPPGYEQSSARSSHRAQVPFSPVEERSPDDMPEGWLFPGGPAGRDHVVLTGPAGPRELWELAWEHRARVLVSLCPLDTQEKVNCSKGATQLGTFLAMEQLLQQAGAECTVDVFNVALKQSQACGLMTPTLEQYIYLYNCLDSALVDGWP
ncbi:Receptor-type tyrosine-protein phosphatase V [Tupaia chinensis]|uniref:protein-tyrosine-phosphatase n=1 Tax=Tupaia chinensis TaxID=246437 RepID=L9JAW8_TUPCH|nr:Receptor-type tyrosine-protein phosphatase V [Tupaia chinensis]